VARAQRFGKLRRGVGKNESRGARHPACFGRRMHNATLLMLGLVLVAMALAQGPVERLPLSAALIYLAVGWIAAALGTPLEGADPQAQAPQLVVVSQWAVLISLFGIGLRLRAPPTFIAWRTAAQLASSGMVLTIALATVAGHWLLGLDWPAALLLAAILAPTDPVLASEVRIRDTGDRDAVRLSLTAEGALNDATAFPAVMLALGWLGLHDLGAWAGGWLLRDVVWSLAGGIAVGWIGGRVLGWAVRSRLERGQPLGWDELLYLGTIALSYAAATALQVSVFFAVFATGLALLHQTPKVTARMRSRGLDSADLSMRLLAFGERGERLAEVTMVMFIGAAMSWVEWRWQRVAFALVLIVLVRPLAVFALLRGPDLPATQRRLIGWLGIRGVGSLFYLLYALQQGVGGALGREIVSACLLAISASVFVHGVSTTPLMSRYQRWRSARAK
jgi:sodium/hydrogen antiporter